MEFLAGLSLFIAAVCAALTAFGIAKSERWNLVAASLFFFELYFLLGGAPAPLVNR